MDPAQRVLTDGELAGIVADNHALAQKVMRRNAAPQRALGGDLYRVGGDNECRDAALLEMRLPGGWIGKLLVRVRCEAGDDGPSEGSVAVQTPLPALCRAPVSSTVTQPAFCKPARNTSRASARKSSCPAISSRITCRFEMLTPIARSSCTVPAGTLHEGHTGADGVRYVAGRRSAVV
jgi:hypothetical protein